MQAAYLKDGVPRSDIFSAAKCRPLICHQQLEGVHTNLDEVAHQGQKRSKRESADKQNAEAKLNGHFVVIVKRAASALYEHHEHR